MIEGIELELKYRVADRTVGDRLLAAEWIGSFEAAGSVRTTQHEDRYFDTADRALARTGFAARLRSTPSGTIVSVKSLAISSESDALVRREELEGPADRSLDAHAWPGSAARSLVLELCGDGPLIELVTIRQLRRRRELRVGTTVAELSVDDVDVVSRGRVVDRFTELEVELLSGPESELADLGVVLGREAALAPAAGSKLEAALRAVEAAARPNRHAAGSRQRPRPSATDTGDGRELRSGRSLMASEPEAPDGRRASDVSDAPPAERDPSAIGILPPDASHVTGANPQIAQPLGAERLARELQPVEPPPPLSHPVEPVPPVAHPVEAVPPVARSPGVAADDTIAEAGRKALRFHFARMLAHEAGTRAGKDPEELHDMRVATRRMRAAWRVFGDGFVAAQTRRHRSRLRRVARRLGDVRDLDVLIEAADRYRKTLPHGERDALDPLVSAWRQRRDDARVALLAELDSAAYRRFVDEFATFVATEGAAVAPVAPTSPHRVRDTAPALIWSAFERVRAYEPVLRWADVATLHELRIAAKWLRYAIEFVREPLGPNAGDLVARVAALQDHLGFLHDADVAASLIRGLLVEGSARLSATETAAIGRYLVDRERELARLRRTIGRPWRGVAGLGFRRRLARTAARL